MRDIYDFRSRVTTRRLWTEDHVALCFIRTDSTRSKPKMKNNNN